MTINAITPPLAVAPSAVALQAPKNGNPGIVPPWLRVYDPVTPIVVDPDVPRILDAHPTLYDPGVPTLPVLPDPGGVHIM